MTGDDDEGEDSEESEEEDDEYDDETTNRQATLLSKPTGLNNAAHARAYGGGALGLVSDDEEEAVKSITRSHTHMGGIKPVAAKVSCVNYASQPLFAGN